MKIPRRITAHAWAWAALLAGGLALRLWELGRRAMSHDESLHAFYSHLLATTGVHHHDPMLHGPLLFQLNAAVFAIVGDNDFTARLLFALAGAALAATPLLFRRALGATGALCAGALIVLSPSLLFYSRYMRNDVLLALLCMLWIWTAAGYIASGRVKWLWPMAVIMALCFACKETAFIFGAFLGAWLLGLGLWRWRQGGPGPRHNRPIQLAVLMLAMVAPFAAPLLHLTMGWDALDYQSRAAIWHGLLAVGLMGALGVGLAWLWLGRHALWGGRPPQLEFWDFLGPACLMWIIDLLLFGNWGRNLTSGLLSGLVGSVGYWLVQHGVARGGQPWFYYLMLTLIYEFAPLILALAGGAALLRRGKAGVAQPASQATDINLPALALAWSAFSLAAYSLAGEKMPWLLVNIALPLCLLGGWWLGRSIDRPRSAPTAGNVAGRRWPGLAALVLLAAVAAVSVRASLMANFVNDQEPVELLVYAHGTPHIKPALAEVRAALERGAPVAYDHRASWPMAWYLRNFKGRFMVDDAYDPRLDKAAAIFCGDTLGPVLAVRLAESHQIRAVPMTWWPKEGYRDVTWQEFGQNLADPDFWAMLWAYFWSRTPPGGRDAPWPLRAEMYFIVPDAGAGGATRPLPAGIAAPDAGR